MQQNRGASIFLISFFATQGVPVRIEVGPRDLEKNACVVARRDIPGKDGKTFDVSLEPSLVVSFVEETLKKVQQSLLEAATKFRNDNIVDVSSYEELQVPVDSCICEPLFFSG